VQARNYVLPSSTSWKEVPAAFVNTVVAPPPSSSGTRGRKRTRSEIEQDSLDAQEEASALGIPPSSNPSTSTHILQEAIAAKRLQNTHAARRSRARKLGYLKGLEDEVGWLKAVEEEVRVFEGGE
jgi:hypothetical protein